MWLCGFLEILQIITEFKRSEKAKGAALSLVSLSVLFQRNCFSAAKERVPLFKEGDCIARRSLLPHGIKSEKCLPGFTHIRVWFDGWKSQPAGWQVTSELSNVTLASTLRPVKDYLQDYCSHCSICTLGLHTNGSLNRRCCQNKTVRLFKLESPCKATVCTVPCVNNCILHQSWLLFFPWALCGGKIPN